MWARVFPILEWGRGYDRLTLASDLVAAMVVTIMLVPQSLAYATLAGLPPQMGLYASVAPLVAYAVFGASRTMAVGPVAVVSLMTLTAASRVAAPGSAEYVAAALQLALMSGLMLLAMGIVRMGALAKLLSSPVAIGFTVASSLVIAAGQAGAILGVPSSGQTLPKIVPALAMRLTAINPWTLAVGAAALWFLTWSRKGTKPLLVRAGLSPVAAGLVARAGPVAAIIATTCATVMLDLPARGVAIVGAIPRGLPPFTAPVFDPALWLQLAVPALLISIVGFVSSVSVAQSLAARRRERIEPSQELVGLGVSNLAAALTGGFPIAGGFARSVVNFDAGARTPAAGAYTAVGIALAAVLLTPLLHFLPVATLAATIIVSVLSIVDPSEIVRVWRYSKRDFAAMATTVLATLLVGVEAGLAIGIALSVAIHLQRSSTPHAAVVGQVPGTQQFRNVERHEVITAPAMLMLRIDEALTFTNAAWTERKVVDLVAARPEVRHVVLMCSAVNAIDASALESLKSLNGRLHDAGVALHLSEVKGPVMDRLDRSDFLADLTGQVFFSQYDAFRTLAPGSCDTVLPDKEILVSGAGI